MNYEYNDDIDYENMDDLPIHAHIEWNHYIAEELPRDYDFEVDWMFV